MLLESFVWQWIDFKSSMGCIRSSSIKYIKRRNSLSAYSTWVVLSQRGRHWYWQSNFGDDVKIDYSYILRSAGSKLIWGKISIFKYWSESRAEVSSRWTIKSSSQIPDRACSRSHKACVLLQCIALTVTLGLREGWSARTLVGVEMSSFAWWAYDSYSEFSSVLAHI